MFPSLSLFFKAEYNVTILGDCLLIQTIANKVFVLKKKQFKPVFKIFFLLKKPLLIYILFILLYFFYWVCKLNY